MAPLTGNGYEPARAAVPIALVGPLAWLISTGMPTPAVVEIVPAATLADDDKGDFP